MRIAIALLDPRIKLDLHRILSRWVSENVVNLVGYSTTLRELIPRISSLNPDLIITEQGAISELNSVEILKEYYPNIKILFYSDCPEDLNEYIWAMNGYCHRQSGNLLMALTVLKTGSYYWDAQIYTALKKMKNSSVNYSFTPRQFQVLKLLETGATNKQIASEMGIASDTVKAHIRNIMNKLMVDNRTELVSFIHRNRLISSYQP